MSDRLRTHRLVSLALHPTRGALLTVLSALVLGAQAPQPILFREDASHTGVSKARLFTGQGGIHWRAQTGQAVRSTPAITATRVYVGSGDGNLYALDRKTGAVVWRFAAGSAVDASPSVANELVICATIDGRIFAVHENTGGLRWSMQTGPALPRNAPRAAGWDLFASSPVIIGKTVVIGAQDGAVYALDLESGKQRWKVQTEGKVRSTPAVSGQTVVVGSFDGKVYALDLNTGKEKWVHRTVGDTLDSKKFGFDRRAVQSSPAIADGMVYVGSRDGGLYSIDLNTGERRWRFTHRGSWVVGSPAVSGGTVFVGSSDGHFLQAVDGASGKELWRYEAGENVLASPLRIGDLLIAATYNTGAPRGDLIAFDAASGAVRWRLRLDDATVSSPAVYDNEIYLGTERGTVLAIHQANPVIPRLAVYYDSTLASKGFMAGGRLAFDYFREQGYEALNADSLMSFLGARVRDSVPSAVVFALDALPVAMTKADGDTTLIQRYLRAGGKVVWFGEPIGTLVYDSTGRLIGDDPKRMERYLDVSSETMDYDQGPAKPTEVGKQWGVDQTIRGAFPISPSAVSKALALDAGGLATAWVKEYRADRPGSGFVQLWGFGANVERLPVIRAVTEYGLLQRAEVGSPATAAR